MTAPEPERPVHLRLQLPKLFVHTRSPVLLRTMPSSSSPWGPPPSTRRSQAPAPDARLSASWTCWPREAAATRTGSSSTLLVSRLQWLTLPAPGTAVKSAAAHPASCSRPGRQAAPLSRSPHPRSPPPPRWRGRSSRAAFAASRPSPTLRRFAIGRLAFGDHQGRSPALARSSWGHAVIGHRPARHPPGGMAPRRRRGMGYTADAVTAVVARFADRNPPGRRSMPRCRLRTGDSSRRWRHMGVDVVLSDDVLLDRIDEIVPSGTDIEIFDQAYVAAAGARTRNGASAAQRAIQRLRQAPSLPRSRYRHHLAPVHRRTARPFRVREQCPITAHASPKNTSRDTTPRLADETPMTLASNTP